MKKLVIFYSLEGNTTFVAEAIAEATDAEILELKPKKDLNPKSFTRFIIAGIQIIFKIKPALMEFDKDIDNYDILFIGTPVWAANFTPSLRSLFSNVIIENKKIALFCCYGDNPGKTFKSLKKQLTGNVFVGEIGFKDPIKQNETKKKEILKEISDWAKQVPSEKASNLLKN